MPFYDIFLLSKWTLFEYCLQMAWEFLRILRFLISIVLHSGRWKYELQNYGFGK